MQTKADPIKIAASRRNWDSNNRERRKELKREWYKNNKEKAYGYVKNALAKKPEYYSLVRRARGKLRNYGLTLQDYALTLVSQNNKCAICGTDNPGSNKNDFCIDHCHSTNVNRGLLCFSCNTLLGCAKDIPEVLEKAAQYLRNPPGIVLHKKDEVFDD